MFLEEDKMSLTTTLKVTLDKAAVLNQYPEIVVKSSYLETDEFEGGLEYGPDTIRIEPPLNRVIYQFPNGVRITYLGNNEWFLESYTENRNAIEEALKLITPVKSEVI